MRPGVDSLTATRQKASAQQKPDAEPHPHKKAVLAVDGRICDGDVCRRYLFLNTIPFLLARYE